MKKYKSGLVVEPSDYRTSDLELSEIVNWRKMYGEPGVREQVETDSPLEEYSD